ncbi:MAG TPA: rhomboid family intramembrane serine protease [Verrucomicrobiota bacterium]|nr:rhomboid family intramembrane serine protease [Verrucomicrobiota bacterium]HNT13567.1 rhomboid family intramembrane serine protease [Verrucomicrobiota bacterium]
MRAIAQLANATQARTFSDYLLTQKILNEVEEDSGSWIVWVLDEEQITEAQTRLQKFLAQPGAPEFQAAGAQAAQIRADEAKAHAKFVRRQRAAQQAFARVGGAGLGYLTGALIAVCVLVAILSRLGADGDWVRRLVLADPLRADGTFLPEVRAGELWRLVTPVFLHFGLLHLLFNMMWLFQLGNMIEARRGPAMLGTLVLVTGTLPMLAQYLVSGPGFVGGMSGVIYGLAGYAWILGRNDPASGIGLNPQAWLILLIWLGLCFTGMLGRVANTAHVVGLLIGLGWGWLSIWLAGQRRR